MEHNYIFGSNYKFRSNLYEAAYIDGANKFRQLAYNFTWNIRIIVVLLLNIGTLLAVGFEQIMYCITPPFIALVT